MENTEYKESRYGDVADFIFHGGGCDADTLKVTAFEGVERISELYHFRVQLCSDEPAISLEAVVGQPAVVEIRGATGARFINGIVRRFERVGEGTRLTRYSADLAPLHWLLTRRRRCRIFQEHNCPDMTVPGIVRKVFEDAGIPSDSYRFALQRQHGKREYVVQYRESEMNFISRLMEQEGLFYFFEHAADGHKMVVGDGSVAHAPCPNQGEVRFRSPRGLAPENNEEHVYRVRDQQQIQTGAVRLDDFNFIQPQTDLSSMVKADLFSALEHHDYPGGYGDKQAGAHYAKLRLQEHQCARSVTLLEGTARTLQAGYKFKLIEHPVQTLNREYLIIEITHRGSQPQSAEEEAGVRQEQRYLAELRAIPAEAPFRAPRNTPRPMVRGTQTAIVVGPPGEEIYTDKYGRVKVQFHWDEEGRYDEHSSCWIRVSQGLAGGQYGMLFLPRVGQEVVVDFLEGDPDRPLIVGRVYNNDCMPPYKLPDEKTKSTVKTRSTVGGGGVNELRFEDKKGGEQILIHAQKDLHLHTVHDQVETIDHDRHVIVKQNQIEHIKQSHHSEVGLDVKERVGGTKSLEVKGDLAEEIKGKHSEKIASALYIKAGSDIVLEADSSLTLKVKGNFIKIDDSGVQVLGQAVKLNCAGATAGVGVPAALQAPEAPVEADTVIPGYDVTYALESREAEALNAGRVQKTPDTAPEEEPSWIEIEMVDEAGQPWPREPYEIVAPDGKVKPGRLDSNGQARVWLANPGLCQIRFPKLDPAAWGRIE